MPLSCEQHQSKEFTQTLGDISTSTDKARASLQPDSCCQSAITAQPLQVLRLRALTKKHVALWTPGISFYHLINRETPEQDTSADCCNAVVFAWEMDNSFQLMDVLLKPFNGMSKIFNTYSWTIVNSPSDKHPFVCMTIWFLSLFQWEIKLCNSIVHKIALKKKDSITLVNGVMLLCCPPVEAASTTCIAHDDEMSLELYYFYAHEFSTCVFLYSLYLKR